MTDSMMTGENGYEVEPILTVGQEIGDYALPGVMDGVGAYQLDYDTVRILVNHEFLNGAGSEYTVTQGTAGASDDFTLSGARISYIDINKFSFEVEDAGLAYNRIYDANGDLAEDASFLSNDFAGFSRFCSSALFEAEQFGGGSGLSDRIYFTGEEDGGFFNRVGGAEWALNPETGELWQIPAMGRGAWENITELDTGTTTHVAFILADDTSPFDFDGDGENEAAPLFMYVGEKDPDGNFLEKNGLSDGKLYVWVPLNPKIDSPAEFNGEGSLKGRWVELDNTPHPDLASEDGASGFDEYGYPTQGNLWLQAKELGAFGFSRPEDVSTNPSNGGQFVLASTGVDTYDDGVDTYGTLYTMTVEFAANGNPKPSTLEILYDGDADSDHALRSPDNLDWADDGMIYVQEDKAEDFDTDGNPLFTSDREAGIVKIDPSTGAVERIATIDRDVVLDASLADPEDAFDTDLGDAGEWESSGVLDVSTLFGYEPGELFIFDVQAHGIEDQATKSSGGEGPNPESLITDDNLVEGGQLSFLLAPGVELTEADAIA